nr:hypothetical protein [uncultured Flavobacterium sp.]
MKRIIYLVLILSILSCSKQGYTNHYRTHVFLLDDTNNSKYLVDSINKVYQKKIFTKSPLVAIDGIVLKYDKTKDTLILPLKKSDITSVTYLGEKVSAIIYGKKEIYGAIVINTVALNK